LFRALLGPVLCLANPQIAEARGMVESKALASKSISDAKTLIARLKIVP
jgi:hypothetical protein